MLEGDFYCYGGTNPHASSDLQMGVEPVTISDAVYDNGILWVRGENFTQWSRPAGYRHLCDPFRERGAGLA